MLLHSYKIRFIKNNQKLSYIANLDKDFKNKMDLYFR